MTQSHLNRNLPTPTDPIAVKPNSQGTAFTFFKRNRSVSLLKLQKQKESSPEEEAPSFSITPSQKSIESKGSKSLISGLTSLHFKKASAANFSPVSTDHLDPKDKRKPPSKKMTKKLKNLLKSLREQHSLKKVTKSENEATIFDLFSKEDTPPEVLEESTISSGQRRIGVFQNDPFHYTFDEEINQSELSEGIVLLSDETDIPETLTGPEKGTPKENVPENEDSEPLSNKISPYKFIFSNPNRYSMDDSLNLDDITNENLIKMYNILAKDLSQDSLDLSNGFLLSRLTSDLLIFIKEGRILYNTKINKLQEELQKSREEIERLRNELTNQVKNGKENDSKEDEADEYNGGQLKQRENRSSEENQEQNIGGKRDNTAMEEEHKMDEENINREEKKVSIGNSDLNNFKEQNILIQDYREINTQSLNETNIQFLEETSSTEYVQKIKQLQRTLQIKEQRYVELLPKLEGLLKENKKLQNHKDLLVCYKENSLEFMDTLGISFKGLIDDSILTKYTNSLNRLHFIFSIVNSTVPLISQREVTKRHINNFFGEIALKTLINKIIQDTRTNIRKLKYMEGEVLKNKNLLLIQEQLIQTYDKDYKMASESNDIKNEQGEETDSLEIIVDPIPPVSPTLKC